MPRNRLHCVIVVFPDHTHLLFFLSKSKPLGTLIVFLKECFEIIILKKFNSRQQKHEKIPCILLDFSLYVKAATLIFISGRGSAISSAK